MSSSGHDAMIILAHAFPIPWKYIMAMSKRKCHDFSIIQIKQQG